MDTPILNGDLTTGLFIQELKSLVSSVDKDLQINQKIGGALIVDGFRSISTLHLCTLCRKYGKRFDVNFASKEKTIRINFNAIPDYFEKKPTHVATTPPFLTPVSRHVEIETAQAAKEKIAVITKGTIVCEINTTSTSTITLTALRLTSDTVRAIQNIHQVVNVVILPSKFQVVLMQENDSRTSLSFLKEHRPELFTCVSNKRKYTACKNTYKSATIQRRTPRRKRLGSARWHLW